MKKVCTYFGPLDSACKAVIDENFDKIWNMITSDFVSIIHNYTVAGLQYMPLVVTGWLAATHPGT